MALANHLRATLSLLNNVKINYLNKKIPREPQQAVVNFQIELVNCGEELFKQLFRVGCQANSDHLASFKDLAIDSPLVGLVQDTGRLIVDVEDWLLQFLASYPYLKIHIDQHEQIDNDAMEVRSGFQFMLDLFNGADKTNKLDVTLGSLREEAAEDFDTQISLAKNYIEVKIRRDGEMYSQIPNTHTWWF